MNKRNQMQKEALENIKEVLENGYAGYYEDLHNEVFNTDYYIIGTPEAKRALIAYGVFDAIKKVMQYEKENFGEIYTDISDPEKLINTLYYIIGEEVLSSFDFSCKYDGLANDETNAEIVQTINDLLQ